MLEIKYLLFFSKNTCNKSVSSVTYFNYFLYFIGGKLSITSHKQHLLKSILSKIDNSNHTRNKNKKTSKKVSKKFIYYLNLLSTLFQIPPSTKTLRSCKHQKLRTIHVGWLHKMLQSENYKQMKKPLGGVKEIKLDPSKNYVVEDIIRLAIHQFTLNSSWNSFDNCIVQLGYFNGHVISSFSNSNGENCGFWEFYQNNHLATSRFNFIY